MFCGGLIILMCRLLHLKRWQFDEGISAGLGVVALHEKQQMLHGGVEKQRLLKKAWDSKASFEVSSEKTASGINASPKSFWRMSSWETFINEIKGVESDTTIMRAAPSICHRSSVPLTAQPCSGSDRAFPCCRKTQWDATWKLRVSLRHDHRRFYGFEWVRRET